MSTPRIKNIVRDKRGALTLIIATALVGEIVISRVANKERDALYDVQIVLGVLGTLSKSPFTKSIRGSKEKPDDSSDENKTK